MHRSLSIALAELTCFWAPAMGAAAPRLTFARLDRTVPKVVQRPGACLCIMGRQALRFAHCAVHGPGIFSTASCPLLPRTGKKESMAEIVPVPGAYKLTIYVPETSPSPGSPAVGALWIRISMQRKAPAKMCCRPSAVYSKMITVLHRSKRGS